MNFEKFCNVCFKKIMDIYDVKEKDLSLNAIYTDENCKRAIYLDMNDDTLYMCHTSKNTGNDIFVAGFKMDRKCILKIVEGDD